EMKFVMLAVLAHAFSILGFTALACVMPSTVDSLANMGPHGFSEVLYAYTSGTANNGSAFAGFNANTPFFNTTIGLAMLVGRYLTLLPMLAVAG
ncbi:potassium-transporting ATPase subunit KdpA, partial [Escherichia coli]|nr:potassium-transporting ATPase subunit KdpA [Escherichia coli]